MTITTKDSILKKWYEYHGQQSFFGYDNLEFKTVNHPRKNKLVNLCNKFKIKNNNKIGDSLFKSKSKLDSYKICVKIFYYGKKNFSFFKW